MGFPITNFDCQMVIIIGKPFSLGDRLSSSHQSSDPEKKQPKHRWCPCKDIPKLRRKMLKCLFQMHRDKQDEMCESSALGVLACYPAGNPTSGWKPGTFDWWTVRCASHHNVPTYINFALVHDVRHQKQQNQHSKTWQGTPKKDVPWHFRAKSCLMFMNFHRYEVSQHHISASEDLT